MSSSPSRHLIDRLTKTTDIELVRTLSCSSSKRMDVLSTAGLPEAESEVHVLHASQDSLASLRALAASRPDLIIEEDAELHYGDPTTPALRWETQGAGVMGALNTIQIPFLIVNVANKGVPNAKITLKTDLTAFEATTDAEGRALVTIATTPTTRVEFVQVLPESGYWDFYREAPEISLQTANVCQLVSLSEFPAGFPTQFHYGWGQRLMGQDKLQAGVDGAGVKVAVIDSGIDRAHPALQHVTAGRDFTTESGAESWSTDSLGHGTHTAGIITAKDQTLTGFAPHAEVHILKIFPGGHFSSLVEALEYCIEHDMDVVNLSLGNAESSEIVEHLLAECRAHGIACIVAAGNSGGPVQFPARSPNVLAVSAVGVGGQTLQSSWDFSQVDPQAATQGVFVPRFSCRGQEIDVCGPGVGIISTYLNGGYKPESGTSMAAPHITGMAALLLAHHPQLRTLKRSHERVQALFELLVATSRPLLDKALTGSGLPGLEQVASVLLPEAKPTSERLEANEIVDSMHRSVQVLSTGPQLQGPQPSFSIMGANPTLTWASVPQLLPPRNPWTPALQAWASGYPMTHLGASLRPLQATVAPAARARPAATCREAKPQLLPSEPSPPPEPKSPGQPLAAAGASAERPLRAGALLTADAQLAPSAAAIDPAEPTSGQQPAEEAPSDPPLGCAAAGATLERLAQLGRMVVELAIELGAVKHQTTQEHVAPHTDGEASPEAARCRAPRSPDDASQPAQRPADDPAQAEQVLQSMTSSAAQEGVRKQSI